MGALSTSVVGFYERLEWKRWLGPSYVRYDSDLIRSEEEDGGIMVLPFGPSKDIDLTASLACPNRSGDDW